MLRLLFSFALLLLLSGQRPVAAQSVIEKNAPVPAGQAVTLDLKHATTIRVRPATDGQLRVRATVSINQNKLNDAFELDLTPAGNGLRVASDLNKKRLEQAKPGDCPANGTMYYGTWNGNKQNSAPVCADIVFEVTVPAATDLRISTISGDIDVQGLTGELQAKSISGFVDVSWPAARAASVALKTITGEVYTDQDVAFVNRQENPIVGYEVKGTLAGGTGPALRLESISGDVFFRRAK
ncbi:DUF4097 domain-containing protein [Hymenobacter weizhouensis]|uniref:DUF4097 domain-containing protein n=1 Tax=Hymenobacter sp. YIM 151500-1 TaxID=2987689 RepID=UPI002226DDCF|nr:DUF4097 domain-containing protein [Hymenobacter sp. YIM 151500-1]UYZ62824.1 DUF4097 domain-containing protein [Hymenobacter sp. YIM 151500-1]